MTAVAPGYRLSACILVPTFRRTADLRRCILAVAAQVRPADEFIIVVRDIDLESQQLANEFAREIVQNVKAVVVNVPGQVQALNAGLRAAESDIIAITDDDATPHADWLSKIVATFESSDRIGGVGGRDLMRINGRLLADYKAKVGRVPPIGPHIGNHHAGFGAARPVDMLKGVNGAYRRVPLLEVGFDTRLRGTGAQVHWEISLGIALRRRGWKLIYDPTIMVDHFLASRHDEDQRDSFNALAVTNATFNETFIRLEHQTPLGRALFLIWATLVGTRVAPGLVQLFRFLPRAPKLSYLRFQAAIRGRFDAVGAVRSLHAETAQNESRKLA